MQFILGSASPRRKELLKMIVDSFTILTSNSEEKATFQSPDQFVQELALQKATNVSEIFKNTTQNTKSEDTLIIGADTIVYHDGQVLGKPQNTEHAYDMLSSLSGNMHQVYTGVCLLHVNDDCQILKQIKFSECTNVFVDSLTDDEIKSYIATHEPDDKAGAYAVQGLFAKHICKIEGDYFNVVGLPVHTLYESIKNNFPSVLK